MSGKTKNGVKKRKKGGCLLYLSSEVTIWAQCAEHSTYQVTRYPHSGCPTCVYMWLSKQAMDSEGK